jgi:hypothetical protein
VLPLLRVKLRSVMQRLVPLSQAELRFVAMLLVR